MDQIVIMKDNDFSGAMVKLVMLVSYPIYPAKENSPGQKYLYLKFYRCNFAIVLK